MLKDKVEAQERVAAFNMMMDQDAEMIDDDEEEESVDPPMKLCGN